MGRWRFLVDPRRKAKAPAAGEGRDPAAIANLTGEKIPVWSEI